MGTLLEAFLRWLDKNHTRFQHALRLVRRTDTSCVLLFDGIHPSVSGYLSETGTGIAVDYKDDIWDLLIDLEVVPDEVNGAFVCELCNPAQRRKFSSYDELVADHCFEPLLEWCNDNFSGDAQLRLYASESGGMRRAKVVFPTSAPALYADGCVAWWHLRV